MLVLPIEITKEFVESLPVIEACKLLTNNKNYILVREIVDVDPKFGFSVGYRYYKAFLCLGDRRVILEYPTKLKNISKWVLEKEETIIDPDDEEWYGLYGGY